MGTILSAIMFHMHIISSDNHSRGWGGYTVKNKDHWTNCTIILPSTFNNKIGFISGLEGVDVYYCGPVSGGESKHITRGTIYIN